MGPIEWIRAQFGAQIDLRSGKEELTVSAFSLVDGMIRAFSRANVTNAISFIVDKKVVYMDTNDVADDLALIGQAAQQSGVFERPFREMHVVLTHQEAGLHLLVDLGVLNQVVLGTEEMWMDISARVEELRIREGETAQGYAQRIQSFAADPKAIDPYRFALDSITERIGNALRSTLPGSRVRSELAVVQLVRPDAEQIGRFRDLSFGPNVSAPTYRAVPTAQRYGAYADPFYCYYYDPYYDFMSWVLINDMMMHSSWNHWHTDSVYVVDPTGQTLYTGSDALGHVGDGWAGAGAVGFDPSGGLAVADSIPEANYTDVAGPPAAGDASSSGGDWSWGGGDSSDNSGGASCAGASSCSSSSCSGGSSGGSSCGSSCSSASCGSSCNS